MTNKNKFRSAKTWIASIFCTVALAFSTSSSNAQTYLKQDFEAAFTTTGLGAPAGSATTLPAGSAGNWTQSNLDLDSGYASNGTKNWERNAWDGSSWSGTPDATSAAHRPSTGAVNGSGALWFNFVNNGTINAVTRRVESPAVDLSASTSPYLTFSFYDNGTGTSTAANYYYNRAVISTDGGATWQNLSNIVHGYEKVNFTWSKIYIPIPAALRTGNVKIGFEINCTASNPGANPFIDDVRISEYTPTNIVSANNGDWNVGSTWVGGIVPTSANNVQISHNVNVAGTALTTAAQIGLQARCQNLTIDAGKTLTWVANGLSHNLLQVFGNVTINGTLKNSTNAAADGRAFYFGGNLTVGAGGTLTANSAGNINQTGISPFNSSIDALIYTGAGSSSITNNGTITGGRINNLACLGSGTLTIASPITVPYGLGLYDGTIAAGSNLTLGNAVTAGTILYITRAIGQLTGIPNWNNLNIGRRIYGYFSGTQGAHFVCNKRGSVITFGPEVETISGALTIQNGIYDGALTALANCSMAINSYYRYTLGANDFNFNGSTLTLTNGIINTNSKVFTIGVNCAGSSGAQPDYGSGTIGGSYINGSVVKVMSGTPAVSIPLGVGFNRYSPTTNNYCRPISLPFYSGGWSGQTLRFSIVETTPTGTINVIPVPVTNKGAVSALQGNKMYRVEELSGTWPAAAQIAFVSMNAPSPSLAGDGITFPIKDSLVVMQSASPTGPWTKRMNATSTLSGNMVNYALTTARTTSTGAGNPSTTPGPITPNIATAGLNGQYFAWGTTSQTVPNPPTALTPTSNATVCQTTISLGWTHGPGSIAGYLLYLSTSPTFATFVTGYNGLNIGNAPSSTTGAYTIYSLSANTHYYWKLVAINTNGSFANSVASATADFTTNGLGSVSLPIFDGSETGNSGTGEVSCGTIAITNPTFANAGNARWATQGGTSRRTGSTCYSTSISSGAGDEWLILPAATYNNGTVYEANMYVRFPSTSGYTIEARYASAPTVASMLAGTLIIPNQSGSSAAYSLYAGTFNPAISGTYYVGIRLQKPNNGGSSSTLLDDITIRQLPNVNVIPVEFIAPSNCSLSTAEKVSFKIKNVGSATANFATSNVVFNWSMRNRKTVAGTPNKSTSTLPTGGTTGAPLPTASYTLNTGTLAAGATMVVEMGTNASSGNATSGSTYDITTMWNNLVTAVAASTITADTFRVTTVCNAISNDMTPSVFQWHSSYDGALNYTVARTTGITYTPITPSAGLGSAIVLNGGAGYGPLLNIASANTTPAVIRLNVSSTGALSGSSIVSGGAGYLAGGSGTILTANLSVNANGCSNLSSPTITSVTVASGVITTVTYLAGGSGWCPVTIAGGGGSGAAGFATVTNGTITAVTFSALGSGFTSAPTLSFANCGPGSGASALASTASMPLPAPSVSVAPFIDNAVQTITASNLGFNFNYQGTTYTNFSTSSNGFIYLTNALTFTNTAGANDLGGNNYFVTPGNYSRLIAPFYDDLAFSDFRDVTYTVTGAAGSKVLTVQWSNASINMGNTNGPVNPDLNLNFQCKLYESAHTTKPNVIEFIYGSMQGVNKGTGNFAYTYSCGLSGSYVGSGNAAVQSGIFTQPNSGVAKSCQMMALQTPNTDDFGVKQGNIHNEGSNALTELPASYSMYTFTPGSYAGQTIFATAPANDNVGGAITLTANATEPTNISSMIYSSYNATASGNPTPSASYIADDDVWFKFNSIDTKAKVKLYCSGGYDGVMQVYNNSMSLLNTVDATTAGSTELFNSQTTTPLLPLTVGQNYFVRVYHKGGGTTATATTTVTDGVISAVNVVSGGSGYTYGASNTGSTAVQVAPKVTVTGGGGTGAVIVPVITNGVITSFLIRNQGAGYTSAPTITIASPKASVSGQFGIALIQTPFVPATTPDNDEVAGTAISTFILPVSTSGQPTYSSFTTTNATTTAVTPNIGTPCVATGKDVWFKAIIPASGVIAASVTQSFNVSTLPYVSLWVSDDNTVNGLFSMVACNTSASPFALASSLSPGDFVYVRVGEGSGGSGNFAIALSDALVWNGSAGSTWSTPSNWFASQVPVSTSGVRIPLVTNSPIVTTNTTVKNLSVQNGITLNLNGGNLTYTSIASTFGTGSSVRVKGTGALVTSTNASILNGTWIVDNFTKTGSGFSTIAPTAELSIVGVFTPFAGNMIGNNRLFIRSYNTGAGATYLGTGQIAYGTGSITGNVTVERKIAASSYVTYHYVTSPITELNTVATNYGDDYSVVGTYPYQSSATVNPAVWPSAWYFDPAASGAAAYRWFSARLEPMTAGKGFIINTPGNITIDVVGTPRNVDTSVPMVSGETNLVGNPYPSTIDLNTLFSDNPTSISGGIVYYVKNGGYVSYSGLGISSPDTYGDHRERFCGHSTSFWVNAAGTSVDFKNTQRNTNAGAIIAGAAIGGGTFYGAVTPSSNPSILRMQLKDATSVDNFDEFVVGKVESTTDAVDAVDGAKFMFNNDLNVNAYIYTVADGQNLVMNFMASTEGKIIPVGVVTNKAGVWTMALENSDAFANEASALVLEDRSTSPNTYYNLKANPSVSFNLPEGNVGNRFYLHIGNTSATTVKTITANNNVDIYSNSNKLFVNFGTELKGTTSVEVFTLVGARMVSLDATSYNGLREINMNNAAAGTYLVKVTNGDTVYTEKVFINKK